MSVRFELYVGVKVGVIDNCTERETGRLVVWNAAAHLGGVAVLR